MVLDVLQIPPLATLGRDDRESPQCHGERSRTICRLMLQILRLRAASCAQDDSGRPGRDDRERAVGMTAESLFSRLGLDDGLRRSETCDRNAERRA